MMAFSYSSTQIPTRIKRLVSSFGVTRFKKLIKYLSNDGRHTPEQVSASKPYT